MLADATGVAQPHGQLPAAGLDDDAPDAYSST